MMDIDKFNIYRGKGYLVVTAIALLFLVVAVVNIPHIRRGVEFTGGILAIADINHSIDVDALKVDLEQHGYVAPSVLQYKTAYGYHIEVESPLTPQLIKGEELRDDIDALLKEYADYANRGKESEGKPVLDKALQKLKELESLAGLNETASTPLDIQELSTKSLNTLRSNEEARLSSILEKYIGKIFSLETVTPMLSKSFAEKVKAAGIASAVLAVIFVFVVFKRFAPSLAVLTGATSDILIALGFLGLTGIPLTLASFAALLMLIGYSLDTDVLLAMRILKTGKGDPRDKAWEALKTGSTMTLTGLLSFTVLFVVALILRISTYYQIGAVVLAGLVGDLFATWGINAVVLLHAIVGDKK